MVQDATAVSVIVPIYNVERYLVQCLDSIAAQTLQSLEVLCVNDGSTDGSSGIAHRYEQVDPRFKVIDKPNGGYGSAVNAGLDAACGTWIGIVEPDDFIDPHMFEDLLANSMLESGRLADIVKSSFWMYYDGSDGQDERAEAPFFGEVMPGHRIETDAHVTPDLVRHHPAIWSAIYRRDFLLAHGIRMMEVSGAGWTDNPWLLQTMLAAKDIVWIPSAYYYYRQTNPGSSSNLKNYHLPFDRLRDMRSIYDELGIDDPKLLSALYSRTLSYITKHILHDGGFPESDPELRSLIREALEPIDAGVLLSRESRVSPEDKDYYRDYMGLKLAAVETRGRRPDPRFSFLLPLANDREGLWKTIDSLRKQAFTNFEVICANCGSLDRGPEIAEDVSRIDERLEVLATVFDDVASGINACLEGARGDYVILLRAGTELPSSYLADVNTTIGAKDGETDIVIMEKSLEGFSAGRFSSTPDTVITGASGLPFEAACVAQGSVGKCYSARFLANSGLRFEDVADADGHRFFVKACLEGARLAIAQGAAPNLTAHESIESDQAARGEGIADLLMTRWASMAGCASNDAELGFARACIAHEARISVERSLADKRPRMAFGTALDWFEATYPAGSAKPFAWNNYDDFLYLEQAALLGYERWVERAARKAAEDAQKALRETARAQSTLGYRAEQTAKKVAKRMLPTSAVKRIVKRKR